MIIVACSRHPLYMAKRMPRCKCAECWEMWAVRRKSTDGTLPRLRVT